MTRMFLFIAVIAATLTGVAYGEKAAKAVDYQKMADEARWLPSREKGLLPCLVHQLNDYQVEVIRKKGDRWAATIKVIEDGKQVYSWKGHLDTVFLDRDGILYYADFDPISTGCKVVAFDLKARKRLWRSDLKGVGPVKHFKYSNSVRLEMLDRNVLAVYGKESAGRYVEIIDLETGKTVGHKLFSK